MVFVFTREFLIIVLRNWFLRPLNTLCVDITVIHTLEECQAAAKYLDENVVSLDTDIAGETNGDWPKGCYRWTGAVVFNNHETGMVNARAQPICKGY